MLICIFLNLANFASGSANQAVPTKIQVIGLHPEGPIEEMKTPGVEVGKLSDLPQPKLLEPFQRDKLFEDVGLVENTSNWDHLERDLLVVNVQTLSKKELQKKYPKIPIKKLFKLKTRIHKLVGSQ